MSMQENYDGVKYDMLIGGVTVPRMTANVSLGAGEIERGMLLSESDGVWNPVNGSDYSNPLAIASQDVGSSESRVSTVYKTGEFNRSALIVGSSVDLDDYEENLRKDGIYLTDIKGV